MKKGETGLRTGSLLTPLDAIFLLCQFLYLYLIFLNVFSALAVFLTYLQGGVSLSLAEQVQVLFLSKREGLVLDLWSHSALRGIHCSGSLFVQGLRREKGPARGEGQSKARVLQGAAGAHLPLNTLSPILVLVLTGHTTLMFGRRIKKAAPLIERSECSIWS